MSKIRVGVIGIGNCFAGLYQGIEFYKQHPEKKVVGVMHENMAGYDVTDLDFVSAFDVGENKVGKPLHQAVFEEPNTVDWVKPMPESKTIVKESPVLDGVGIYVQNKINPIKNKPMDELKKEIVQEIEDTKTEILINYLPVGSDKATQFWADMAVETGCAFVNCIPSFIASKEEYETKFRKAGLPVIGDDIKGMVGATIVHRTLARMVSDRGTVVDKTYQINVGGNTDFLNMKQADRLLSKKISKTESVQSQLNHRLPDDKIYVGPSDFIPFLGNTKLAFIRLEGRMWADRPYSIELRLEVDDKSNSGGIAVDAIRAAKIGLDRGIAGSLDSASSYLMKHPRIQYTDSEARDYMNEFIEGKRER